MLEIAGGRVRDAALLSAFLKRMTWAENSVRLMLLLSFVVESSPKVLGSFRLLGGRRPGLGGVQVIEGHIAGASLDAPQPYEHAGDGEAVTSNGGMRLWRG